MKRRSTPVSSTRTSVVAHPAEAVWQVVASGEAREQWYVDAAPFVFRGAVDRLLGGAGRRWPPPGRTLLSVGDTAGFWRVVEAGGSDEWRLVLEAAVRAPGRVRLTSTVTPLDSGRCRLGQTVHFSPSGVLGLAYLVTDVPAREAVVELTHRRLLGDVDRLLGPLPS